MICSSGTMVQEAMEKPKEIDRTPKEWSLRLQEALAKTTFHVSSIPWMAHAICGQSWGDLSLREGEKSLGSPSKAVRARKGASLKVTTATRPVAHAIASIHDHIAARAEEQAEGQETAGLPNSRIKEFAKM